MKTLSARLSAVAGLGKLNEDERSVDVLVAGRCVIAIDFGLRESVEGNYCGWLDVDTSTFTHSGDGAVSTSGKIPGHGGADQHDTTIPDVDPTAEPVAAVPVNVCAASLISRVIAAAMAAGAA